MTEWLTTGEMIDTLKKGQIAQADSVGKPFVTANENGGISFCLPNGEYEEDREIKIFSQWRKVKWRILPNYVSFDEAMKALEEGKNVYFRQGSLGKYHYKDKITPFEAGGIALVGTELKNHGLFDLVHGKWTIEND